MMRLLRSRPTVRNGEKANFNIDPLTLTRIHFGIRYGEKRLGMHLSNSSIVRRAVQFYADYLDSIVELDEAAPQHNEEMLHLLLANQGSKTHIPEKQLKTLPWKKLNELLPRQIRAAR